MVCHGRICWIGSRAGSQALNLPSRVVLVKLVLQAMLIYHFFVLSSPKTVINEIRSIQQNFLWGVQEVKSKFSLAIWDNFFSPKDRGGLGLRDPEVMGEIQGGTI